MGFPLFGRPSSLLHCIVYREPIVQALRQQTVRIVYPSAPMDPRNLDSQEG